MTDRGTNLEARTEQGRTLEERRGYIGNVVRCSACTGSNVYFHRQGEYVVCDDCGHVRGFRDGR